MPCVEELTRFYEQGKDDLRVMLIYKYAYPTALPTSQQGRISAPQSLAAGGYIGGRNNTPISENPTGRLTTTQRQVREVEAENIADPKQQQVEELALRWTCSLSTCSNRGRLCWWEEDNDLKHYTLQPPELKL